MFASTETHRDLVIRDQRVAFLFGLHDKVGS
jgi:hypothetical protein